VQIRSRPRLSLYFAARRVVRSGPAWVTRLHPQRRGAGQALIRRSSPGPENCRAGFRTRCVDATRCRRAPLQRRNIGRLVGFQSWPGKDTPNNIKCNVNGWKRRTDATSTSGVSSAPYAANARPPVAGRARHWRRALHELVRGHRSADPRRIQPPRRKAPSTGLRRSPHRWPGLERLQVMTIVMTFAFFEQIYIVNR
jgi:hypothetical protein